MWVYFGPKAEREAYRNHSLSLASEGSWESTSSSSWKRLSVVVWVWNECQSVRETSLEESSAHKDLSRSSARRPHWRQSRQRVWVRRQIGWVSLYWVYWIVTITDASNNSRIREEWDPVAIWAGPCFGWAESGWSWLRQAFLESFSSCDSSIYPRGPNESLPIVYLYLTLPTLRLAVWLGRAVGLYSRRCSRTRDYS